MERYMMATKAIHKLGDISRDEPDLCAIYDEDAENFIGNWVAGVNFFDVKFPKSTTRELTDEEKERWNMETKESLVIVLPTDEARKQELRDKLVEYKGRMDKYRPPETQMDTVCKTGVLERLLRDGQVNTWELSQEMAKTYRSGFDVSAFNNACGVIEDYCKTGGQNLRGSTGLRH